MKKLAIAMMMGLAAFSANAQVNYTVQTACNPKDVKNYDTERLRESFLMEKPWITPNIPFKDIRRRYARVWICFFMFLHPKT